MGDAARHGCILGVRGGVVYPPGKKKKKGLLQSLTSFCNSPYLASF